MTKNSPVINRPAISFIADNLGPDRVSLFISGTEGARDVAKLKEQLLDYDLWHAQQFPNEQAPAVDFGASEWAHRHGSS